MIYCSPHVWENPGLPGSQISQMVGDSLSVGEKFVEKKSQIKDCTDGCFITEKQAQLYETERFIHTVS